MSRSFKFDCLMAILIFGSVEFAAGKLKQPFKVTEPYKITPIFYQPEILSSGNGHIFGARDCGGTSDVYEMRHDSCITEYPALCSLVTGRAGRLNVVFIPSETVHHFFLRGGLTTGDGEMLAVDVPVPGQKLTAGQLYLLTVAIETISELQGKIFTGR